MIAYLAIIANEIDTMSRIDGRSTKGAFLDPHGEIVAAFLDLPFLHEAACVVFCDSLKRGRMQTAQLFRFPFSLLSSIRASFICCCFRFRSFYVSFLSLILFNSCIFLCV